MCLSRQSERSLDVGWLTIDLRLHIQASVVRVFFFGNFAVARIRISAVLSFECFWCF